MAVFVRAVPSGEDGVRGYATNREAQWLREAMARTRLTTREVLLPKEVGPGTVIDHAIKLVHADLIASVGNSGGRPVGRHVVEIHVVGSVMVEM